MDQQMLWDVLDPVGDDFEDYLLAPDLADLYENTTDQGSAMSVEDFLSGSGVQYTDATTQGSASMNMWESGTPSSSEHPHSEGTREGTKIESMCPTSLTYNRGGPLRIGVRRSEAVQSSNSNELPQNFDQNLGHLSTSSHAREAVYHPQYTTTSLEPGHTLNSGGSSVTRGSSSRDFGINSENGDDRRGLSLDTHRACKRKHTEGDPVLGSTSGSSSLFSQSENSALHPVSHHNHNNNNANLSAPSDFLSGSTPVTQMNSRVGTSTGVVTSDFSSVNLPGNLEGSQRSVRMRINPTHQHNTPLPIQWAQGSTTDSNVWSTNRSPLPTPSQSVGFRPVCTGASSQSAVSVPVSHRLPRRASSRRVGSSPNNPIIVSERSTGATVVSDEVNSSSAPRTSSLEISALTPAHYIRQLSLPQRSARSMALGEVNSSSILGVNSSDAPALSPPHLSRRQSLPQISTNIPQSVSSPHVSHPQMFGLANGNTSINERSVAAPHNRHQLPLFLGLPNRGTSIPEGTVTAPRATMNSGVHQSLGVHPTRVQGVGSHQSQPAPRAGSTSGVDQLLGPTIAPHNLPTRYARNTPGPIRRSLFTSGAAAYLAANAAPQPVRSATSQDFGRTPGVGLHGHPMAQVRSSLARQRDGVPGIPVSVQGLTAVAAGRSRMISEQIRNMLDQMRRGENVRLEDMFLFDHSIFHGGADLLDRHRDMRLDVDRMSYEELLALEERIGNVSTGLTEEIVMKCLNQRTYKSDEVETAEEVEPCCICQEEYVGGDDLGILDCGHDFHVVCVKQWLMQKNICPICKTTGLKSAEK